MTDQTGTALISKDELVERLWTELQLVPGIVFKKALTEEWPKQPDVLLTLNIAPWPEGSDVKEIFTRLGTLHSKGEAWFQSEFSQLSRYERKGGGLHVDANPVPLGLRPREGVELGCGQRECRMCYELDRTHSLAHVILEAVRRSHFHQAGIRPVQRKDNLMYLFRGSPGGPFVLHDPQLHGYACDYIGGDSGPCVVVDDYSLFLDKGEKAVFQHTQTGKYVAAVRIGRPSMCPCGDDWRQGQAHIMIASEVFRGAKLVSQIGPFTFYDLVFVLESGSVTPREAIAAGYFGDAVYSLRGHVRELECTTPAEAEALLALILS